MLMGEAKDYFEDVVAQIDRLGYETSWKLINCADHGVPQRRERVFVVGFRRDLGIRWTWPATTHSLDTLLDAQWDDGSYWREHRLPAPAGSAARAARTAGARSRPRRSR
jgi:DNA (cytosine-5)-methyltransferase 1